MLLFFDNFPCTLVKMVLLIMAFEDFPSGSVDEDQTASAGDMGSIPSLGRFHMLRSN